VAGARAPACLALQLDPQQFQRVHRSSIVRLDMIAELRSLTNRDAVLRLRDGSVLRASRTYMPALTEALERRTHIPPIQKVA
jgi:two-component system LytT family response regulator